MELIELDTNQAISSPSALHEREKTYFLPYPYVYSIHSDTGDVEVARTPSPLPAEFGLSRMARCKAAIQGGLLGCVHTAVYTSLIWGSGIALWAHANSENMLLTAYICVGLGVSLTGLVTFIMAINSVYKGVPPQQYSLRSLCPLEVMTCKAFL